MDGGFLFVNLAFVQTSKREYLLFRRKGIDFFINQTTYIEKFENVFKVETDCN